MPCLLDSNIVSEISKRTPNPGVLAWFEAAEDGDLFVSVVGNATIKGDANRLIAGPFESRYSLSGPIARTSRQGGQSSTLRGALTRLDWLWLSPY